MKKYRIFSFMFVALIHFAYAQNNEKIYITADTLSLNELKAVTQKSFEESEDDGIRTKSIITALIPEVIDFAVNQVSTALKKRAEKFVANYQTKYIGDNFYWIDATDSKKYKPQIKSFKIIREDNNQINSEIVLKPIIASDGAFFKFEVDNILVKKGRTNKIKNSIDIEIKIDFISKSIKNDTYIESKTSDLKILVEGLHLNQVYNPIQKLSTQWIKVPVLSNKSDKVVGNGTYELLVNITEYDSFKDRAKVLSTTYYAKKSKLSELLEDFLKKD